jgi:hypothetical protein
MAAGWWGGRDDEAVGALPLQKEYISVVSRKTDGNHDLVAPWTVTSFNARPAIAFSISWKESLLQVERVDPLLAGWARVYPMILVHFVA